MNIGHEKRKHELRSDLRGVGAGFELARRRLRANPSRAFCERDVKVTTDFFFRKSESGTLGQTRIQLYLLGQLLGPSDLGQPFLLKAEKE